MNNSLIKRGIGFAAVIFLTMATAAQAQLNHSHAPWTMLLQRYVVDVDEGHASRVDYAGFKQDQAALIRE